LLSCRCALEDDDPSTLPEQKSAAPSIKRSHRITRQGPQAIETMHNKSTQNVYATCDDRGCGIGSQ
jgi:hypothetical protein